MTDYVQDSQTPSHSPTPNTRHLTPPQVLAQGKYMRLMIEGTWEYAQRINVCGIVGVVAVTDDGKLVMVEQYRIPVGRRSIELPAGLAGDTDEFTGEDLYQAAHRELLEETGYKAESMTFLCEGPPSAGTTTEVITLYLATGLTKVGPGGGDHTEDIVVHEIPIEQVPEWLEQKRREGILTDLRIFTGLYFVQK